MRLLKTALLAGVAAITLATGAQAGGKTFERERWSETGRGWAVDYMPEVNSCGMGRPYDNGIELQVYYNAKADAFTLMLMGTQRGKWSAIEGGATYNLRMIMDGGADRWRGTARGIWTNDGHPALVLSGLTFDFIKSFMRRNAVDFYNADRNTWIMGLTLDGSAAAMVGLIECLDAHNSINDKKGSEPEPSKPQSQPQRRPEFRS